MSPPPPTPLPRACLPRRPLGDVTVRRLVGSARNVGQPGGGSPGSLGTHNPPGSLELRLGVEKLELLDRWSAEPQRRVCHCHVLPRSRCSRPPRRALFLQ